MSVNKAICMKSFRAIILRSASRSDEPYFTIWRRGTLRDLT
jgi:hypothetical protein